LTQIDHVYFLLLAWRSHSCFYIARPSPILRTPTRVYAKYFGVYDFSGNRRFSCGFQGAHGRLTSSKLVQDAIYDEHCASKFSSPAELTDFRHCIQTPDRRLDPKQGRSLWCSATFTAEPSTTFIRGEPVKTHPTLLVAAGGSRRVDFCTGEGHNPVARRNSSVGRSHYDHFAGCLATGSPQRSSISIGGHRPWCRSRGPGAGPRRTAAQPELQQLFRLYPGHGSASGELRIEHGGMPHHQVHRQ
jgi:hypothetical protein